FVCQLTLSLAICPPPPYTTLFRSDLEILRNLVNTALQLDDRRGGKTGSGTSLLGESPQMQALRETIDKLARSQAPVYIHGESGSDRKSTRLNSSHVSISYAVIRLK